MVYVWNIIINVYKNVSISLTHSLANSSEAMQVPIYSFVEEKKCVVLVISLVLGSVGVCML